MILSVLVFRLQLHSILTFLSTFLDCWYAWVTHINDLIPSIVSFPTVLSDLNWSILGEIMVSFDKFNHFGFLKFGVRILLYEPHQVFYSISYWDIPVGQRFFTASVP